MRRRTKIILVAIGIAIVWPFAQIGLIAAQAQYFANGRPYCIEVYRSDPVPYYRPVASLLELNAFTLRAPFVYGGGSGETGWLQWTFHAVLAADAGGSWEWRNWSYWNQHFDRLTPQQAKATHLYRADCQPQADFVLKLPLLGKQQA
jgi:hypothetical protein